MNPIGRCWSAGSVGRLRCLSITLAAFALTLSPAGLPQLENTYSDLLDSFGILSAIDSGLFASYRGRDRAAWSRRYREQRKELVSGLASLHTPLPPSDARAVSLMRRALTSDLPEQLTSPANARQPPVACQAAQRSGPTTLRAALYACFDEIGNNLKFENSRYTRVAAFDLLSRLDDPQRRKSLFLAFRPLWEALNGRNQPGSPYRRLLRLAAASPAHAAETAARAIGISSQTVEPWLEQVLDEWSRITGNRPVEPWDYYYASGAADRFLAAAIPRDSLLPIARRYYADLGADLSQLGILYDLNPRPGKDPVAYTARVLAGRRVQNSWRPGLWRVSANYSGGGLSSLNEFIHENGHAIQEAAIRNRPAFLEPGDPLFVEAFADVPSWETYSPRWQQKYLGRAASPADSLRGQYANVMLDLAWALFEVRMLRRPASDPNLVWTGITTRYLHIAPHPEWSWWAVRVQLVDPGYMLNYGLGAIVTADLRRHIQESIGSFDTGNKRWYPWTSAQLLRYGSEYESAALLRAFLGRSVSPQALLDDLRHLHR